MVAASKNQSQNENMLGTLVWLAGVLVYIDQVNGQQGGLGLT